MRLRVIKTTLPAALAALAAAALADSFADFPHLADGEIEEGGAEGGAVGGVQEGVDCGVAPSYKSKIY